MMHWIHEAWTDDVTPTTISNCWHKANILPASWLDAPQTSAAQRCRAAANVPLAVGATAAAVEADAAQVAVDEDVFLEGPLDEFDQAPLQRGGVQGRERVAGKQPHASALAALDEALRLLRRARPDEGDELLDAAALTDYDRGLEVNDVNGLSEEDILHMVLTQDTDQPDSDEDEHDDYATPQIIAADAMAYARVLREYAFALPDKFSPEHVKGLDDMMSWMEAISLQSKKQATLTSAWGL
jgi:hypothetical protein